LNRAPLILYLPAEVISAVILDCYFEVAHERGTIRVAFGCRA
jgi:hypothetical protein